MAIRQQPMGLACLPPGPELSAALAEIDSTQVANGESHQLLIAQYTQFCHEYARLLWLIDDVGRRDPEADLEQIAYLPEPARFAADELRPALAWTRAKAERELGMAYALIHQYPAVYAAMLAGDLDPAKAGLFDSYLAQTSPSEAQRICSELLPKARGWTTSKLAAQLRRLTIGLDPDKARERYERALAQGRVAWYLTADGAACLAVDGIAPDDAAAAKRRIDELACALRVAGHPGRLPELRKQLVIALLDGSLDGLTREQIVTALLAHARAEPEQGEPEGDQRGPGQTTENVHAGEDSAGEGSGVVARPDPAEAARSGDRGRLGTEVRVEMGTLLGEDDHPGELPDVGGPVLADVARRVVSRQRRATWSFAVCDDQGFLLCAGVTRYRPDHVLDGCSGGSVELQVRLSQLERLAVDPPRGWEKLVRDIVSQYKSWPDTIKRLDARPDRRFPTPPLRRYRQIRDRNCRGPGGCGCPASAAEYDHTVDWQYGGLTTIDNGGMCCSHDHDLKTTGGWTSKQPEAGHFEWISPLGQVYRTRGDPVIAPIPDLTLEPPF